MILEEKKRGHISTPNKSIDSKLRIREGGEPMARPLRIDVVGGWYHVTARGNERRAIYRRHSDRAHFLELLAAMRDAYRLVLHAYVLMNNHYHLLVETPEANLSRAMQWLNTSYSMWFNRRHQRCGQLLQGRFKAILVDPHRWALELSRYIHLNPIRVKTYQLDKAIRQRNRAGVGSGGTREEFVRRREVLNQYLWSSYPAYIGRAS
jgi:REP element-mobilizing transposase RayT